MKIKNIFNYSILIISILFSNCSHDNLTKRQPARNVILVEAETSGETITKTFSGVVEEGKSVNAAFLTGGKLLSLNVKEGDRVKKGQLLAVIDDTDYQIGVNQLEVQYNQMASEKKRMDEMFARHNIAPNDYEKFEAGFEQLKLHLEMAKNKLGYTKLYSPSDGFISYKFMQPGELVDAGTPIYKITDDSRLEVAVDLPLNTYINRDKIKRTFGKSSVSDEEIPLKIDSFTPDADNNQLYHMKLGIVSPDKELTTGMNLTVEIEMTNDNSGESYIPSRAIFEDNGKNFVWTFNEMDSTIMKTPVTVIGAPVSNKSMVTGLSGSEKIVAAGVKQLQEGEKVNVVKSPLP